MIKNIKRFYSLLNYKSFCKLTFITKDKIEVEDNDIFAWEIKRLQYIEYEHDNNYYDLRKTIRTIFNIDYNDLPNLVWILNRYYVIKSYICSDTHNYCITLESKH